MRLTTWPVVCERCGQTATAVVLPNASLVCGPCQARDRAPQGETVRLFTPAPNVMPGQLEISD